MLGAYNPILNDVKNRFLPYPESAFKGLEPEAQITDFNIIKELGAGSFGHVFLVEHKATKVQYAIKAIDKRNKANIEEKPYFRREIEIMYKIHHPNVVKLFGHFEDNNYCYFVMEYISKGNIYGLIPKDKRKRLSTKVVCSIMKDVISAVYFLHHMRPSIIHRDIKPENVLLGDGLVAKLTDFGWSNYLTVNKRTTVCGTPIYLAPEIINETGHNEKVDHWCIGVLLFELVTGNVPFQGNDIETLKTNIRYMRIAWPKEMNPDAKNLIMKILQYDPEKRIGLKEMLMHPFFTKYYPNAVKSLIKPDDSLQYKPYIISKDNPKTWDPVVELNQIPTKNEAKIVSNKAIPKTQRSGEKIKPVRDLSPIQIVQKAEASAVLTAPTITNNTIPTIEIPSTETVSHTKFKELKDKYELLKKEYVTLKSKNMSVAQLPIPKIVSVPSSEVEELKKKIKEKDEKIQALSRRPTGLEEDEIEYRTKLESLEKENKSLKSSVERYEKLLKEQKTYVLDTSKIKEIGENLGEKEKFAVAAGNLRGIENEIFRKNFEIFAEHMEKEVRKAREEERANMEVEKKKFTALIEKYDKTLNWIEGENKELKGKLKEAEGKKIKRAVTVKA